MIIVEFIFNVTSDVVCTQTLSVESIHACPGFQDCVYYDQGNMLNLTSLVGRTIDYEFNYDQAFFYTVCQNGLAQQMVAPSNPGFVFTTLYNASEYMSGVWQANEDSSNFTLIQPFSSFSKTQDPNLQYYYDANIDGWIFQYQSNYCYSDGDSLFVVQWMCGGDQSWYFKSYSQTECVVSVIIETNLC